MIVLLFGEIPFFFCCEPLKDKLRNIKILSLFEQKSIGIRQHQTRSGWEHATHESQGTDLSEKVRSRERKLFDWL